jgi:hypothetical protein
MSYAAAVLQLVFTHLAIWAPYWPWNSVARQPFFAHTQQYCNREDGHVWELRLARATGVNAEEAALQELQELPFGQDLQRGGDHDAFFHMAI